MYLQVLVLPVFIVSYGIAKCIREITRGSVMCRFLTTNELIYDRMNTLYNNIAKPLLCHSLQCYYCLFLELGEENARPSVAGPKDENTN